MSTSEGKSSKKDDEPGNPIGELQEFTQKKLLKPPIYEFVTEQGPPHAREFICNIKLGKFADKGHLIFFVVFCFAFVYIPFIVYSHYIIIH